jgi:hypothetical protein
MVNPVIGQRMAKKHPMRSEPARRHFLVQIRLAVLRRALAASKRSAIDARDLSPLSSPDAPVP